MEKRGINVNSKEDIVKVLESTSTGSKLLEMLNPALQKEGIDISNISMKEILDGI
nr:MAG TPA: hypothetical protein [Crassvirales sp.]